MGGPLQHKVQSCHVLSQVEHIQHTSFRKTISKEQNNMQRAEVSHRYSLSVHDGVLVLAEHCNDCSNDCYDYNDPNDGSNDAASGGTFSWERCSWKKQRDWKNKRCR